MKITVTPKEVMEHGCVDVKEAQRILGVGKSTLYQMLKDKVIPTLAVNSKKSIPVVALERYIESRLRQG